MEKIIKKTTNKSFDLQDVQNPALQSMWRQIEMKAFNQDGGGGSVLDNDEEFHDFTGNCETFQFNTGTVHSFGSRNKFPNSFIEVPNDGAMQARIGDLCETLNNRTANRANTFAPSYSALAVKKPTKSVDMANEVRNQRVSYVLYT